MSTPDKGVSSGTSTHFLLAMLTGKMGYYGIRATMLTYLLKNFTEMTRSNSLEIYGYYGAIVLFSGIVGALIADLFFGNKRVRPLHGKMLKKRKQTALYYCLSIC